jgi:hypothetical protein
MGQFNTIYTPASFSGWNNNDRLFVIGNGLSTNSRSNALVILKNGNTGIGTSSPAALLHINGTGTGGGNVVFVGSNKLSNPGNPPVSGSGTRMMWYPDKAAFRAGRVEGTQWNVDNIGFYSSAWGHNTTASGIASTAWGQNSVAADWYSTAWGFNSNAAQDYSTAWGVNTTASGWASTAWGLVTTAPSYGETVFGRWNTLYTPAGISIWNATDRLFVIGNGLSNTNRSDAFTILKSGKVGVGVSDPKHKLAIQVNTKPSNVVADGEGIGIVNTSTGNYWNIHMSASWLRFSYNGTLSSSRINDMGEYIQNSDQRFKTNIAMYSDVLGRIKGLGVMEYNYLNQSSSKKTIGFMAQDVLPLFPELVTADDDEEYLGINYAGFGVVAIKALQEQQVIIENHETEIRDLKQRLDLLEELIKSKN